jgi:hypothetical protein
VVLQKFIFPIILIVSILSALVVIFAIASIYWYNTIKPIAPSTKYYRDFLGGIYYDSTTGCLDICLFKSFSKLDAERSSFRVLTVPGPYAFDKGKIIESGFALDRNFVWWEERKIIGADTTSFMALGINLGKDVNRYYVYEKPLLTYLGQEFGNEINALAKNFKVISYSASDYMIIQSEDKYFLVKFNPQPETFSEISQEESLKYSDIR